MIKNFDIFASEVKLAFETIKKENSNQDPLLGFIEGFSWQDLKNYSFGTSLADPIQKTILDPWFSAITRISP